MIGIGEFGEGTRTRKDTGEVYEFWRRYRYLESGPVKRGLRSVVFRYLKPALWEEG